MILRQKINYKIKTYSLNLRPRHALTMKLDLVPKMLGLGLNLSVELIYYYTLLNFNSIH